MFISSRYIIHNARRDTKSNIVIQMALEHEMNEKRNF